MSDLLYKRYVLLYKQYTKLIATHETMVTKQKYTSLFVYLLFIGIFETPVFGRAYQT